jgi:hypothetical protein
LYLLFINKLLAQECELFLAQLIVAPSKLHVYHCKRLARLIQIIVGHKMWCELYKLEYRERLLSLVLSWQLWLLLLFLLLLIIFL